METTLPLPFLPSVDLGNAATESKERLTRIQLSYLGSVYFTAKDQTLEKLLQFLQRHISIDSYVDATAVTSEEDIIAVLDAGARKVFVKSVQLGALSKYNDRVVSVLASEDISSTPSCNGALIYSEDTLEASRVLLERISSNKTSPIFFTIPSKDTKSFVMLAQEFSAIPIIPATNLTIRQQSNKHNEEPSSDEISVPTLVADSWTSDRPDGLVPTVVTDERGITLGLVYSSRESLAESLRTGAGVYQSRKRGLWYKGASSGDTQELLRVSLDCDQDCLRFVVRQNGRGRLILLYTQISISNYV
jgi:phosphoribosyl-ATP pyrophosphohydrolase/phosphoribosyl-AMP cyclohydrolase/histidinol dehydrogenase